MKTYKKICSECLHSCDDWIFSCYQGNETIDDINNYNGETCDDFNIWSLSQKLKDYEKEVRDE